MRFLCFHGKGTNSKIFEAQLARILVALGNGHRFDFIDGSVPTTAAPELEQLKSPGDEFLRYVDGGSLKSRVSLIRDLDEFIMDEGPFDGLVGFSEGAAVAATFVFNEARGPCRQRLRVKCAIFFCGGVPEDPISFAEGTIRHLDPQRDGEIIDIPTAHIWADNDLFHPDSGHILQDLCSKETRESYVHQLGHFVPGSKSDQGVQETVRTIQRVIERATKK